MSNIHPSAVIAESAKLADNVKIGPFCIVGPNVSIGEGSELIGQCCVTGYTTLGKNNIIHQNATIGGNPQDLDFENKETYLEIGDNNCFREGVTINPGTDEGTKTIVGSNNYFMINSHVAHNCEIGNNVILVNGALIAGHIHIDDNVIISGNAAIHQFCRVGKLAMLSGNSSITMDLPPYIIASERNKVSAINLIGMRRNGSKRDAIRAMKNVFKIFYRSELTTEQAINEIEKEYSEFEEVQNFLKFVKIKTKRGILK